MNKRLNVLLSVLIETLTALTVMVLAFVIYFIAKGALPTFDKMTVPDFLLGRRWMPVAYIGEPSFGTFNFVAAMLYVSLVAMVLVVTAGVRAVIYLSCVTTQQMRGVLYPFVDLLAGIPSVIYGFMGLTFMVEPFIRAGVRTGSYVLTAGIPLTVMLLPFLISSCSEAILKVRKRYQPAADTLGIPKWHIVATIVLLGSWKNILLFMILTIGRAVGGITAVMMVIGNANLFPSLLGKGESIVAVIALEMGTTVAGSTHYHAPYAAGLVLMLLLSLINSGIALLRSKPEQ